MIHLKRLMTAGKVVRTPVPGTRVGPEAPASGGVSKEGKKHSKEFKGSDEELGAVIKWVLEQKKD
jgi:hypothetical protein